MSSIKEDVKNNHKLRSKVAKALMTERWFKEMGQQELADLIGTQKSNISRIEKGEQNITVDYIEMIAKALNKDVSFVMEDHKIGYGDYSEYYLKIYDEVLLRFSLTRDLSLSAKILDINESMRHLFPLDLELTDEGLLTWLRKRTVPGSRELIGSEPSQVNLHVLRVGDLDAVYENPGEFASKAADIHCLETSYTSVILYLQSAESPDGI